MVMGGMVIGEHEDQLAAFAEGLLAELPALERRAGITVGPPYRERLEAGTAWHSSVLPSQAIAALRDLSPSTALNFLHDVQRRYIQGDMDLQDVEAYGPIAACHNVDAADFLARLHGDEAMAAAEQDFMITRSLGIDTFPTLCAEVGDRFYGLANGYRNTEELTRLLDALLKVDPTSS